MKFRIHGMVLSLFFALGLVFSFSIEASAHEGNHNDPAINAEMVVAESRTEVEAFLTHISNHLNEIGQSSSDLNEVSRNLVIFAREAREEGIWNDKDDMYVIGVFDNGYITNHGLHTNLYGHRFDLSSPGTIKNLFDNATTTAPYCEQYNGTKWACAIKGDTAGGTVTSIVGYNHASSDALPPDCSKLRPLTPGFTAVDVNASQDKDDLKQYVKDIIETSVDLLTRIGTEAFMEGISPLDPTMRAEFARFVGPRSLEEAACFSMAPFKDGSIYAFIMSADEDATVFLNGQSSDLNGLNSRLTDPMNPADKQDIAKLIRDAVTVNGDLMDGQGGFVDYHWLIPGDQPDPPDWFEQDPQVVPGMSLKTSYVEVRNTNTSGFGDPVFYIFGSGIYPPDMMADDDDDGACAIAGAGHTSQSALLNLFLIASVLFSVVFLRRRA